MYIFSNIFCRPTMQIKLDFDELWTTQLQAYWPTKRYGSMFYESFVS